VESCRCPFYAFTNSDTSLLKFPNLETCDAKRERITVRLVTHKCWRVGERVIGYKSGEKLKKKHHKICIHTIHFETSLKKLQTSILSNRGLHEAWLRISNL
jgi:hypothetical protein